MKPQIGILEINLKNSCSILTTILSDEMTLYTKTRKFHWNVTGESFMELHKLFENQYSKLETSIDEVAERISKLGGKTVGTMEEFKKLTILREHPNKYPSSKEMLLELLEDHETIIVQLREFVKKCSDKFDDAGTTDMLTKMMEEHETTAWTLRRYIK